MHLSTTLLFIGLTTFCCANPVVRFHRIDRVLREHYQDADDNGDEDITGIEPAPEIPRDSDVPELDIDKDNENDDDSYMSRKKRRVIGVAPPAILPPVEDEDVKNEEKERGNGRRRRELRDDDDNDNVDEGEVVLGGTPPPFLPAPTADPLGPLWVRLRRQTLPADDSDERSKSDEDDTIAYRLPRHVEHKRQKRVKKSLSRRTRCVDGHCSEESNESKSNEMTFLEPEDKYDGPLVRVHRTLQTADETEEVLVEDSSKQMDADDEGALRLPRHAEKDMAKSTPVEEEEGGSHIAPGFGPIDEDEEKTIPLKRVRRHRSRPRHHRQPLHKHKRNMGGKTGRRGATGENRW